MRSRLRRLYRGIPGLRRGVREARNGLIYAVLRAVMALLHRVSLDRALRWADRAGDLMYRFAGGPRRLALAHVALAFGDAMSPVARERIVRASFRNVVRCLVEVLSFEAIRPQLDTYVEVEGWEHAQAVQTLQRGAIVVTGHIGNWEILAAYFALKGLPIAAVARRMHDPRINTLLLDFRTANGVQTILRESSGSSREILSVLRRNGVLAMLIDQDTHAPSISVPFFGRQARTPAAAAALALRRNLPVIAAFAQRRPGGGHRLTILPPLRIEPTGDRKRDVLELTKLFSQVIEDRIRANPVEWVWWHRRWRRGPTPQLDLDAEVP
jgi:KDO2-lipid IV(A) lauroyltransferase